MKLNRSSREPGGQASNWRPPGTGSDPPSRPEVDFSRQNTNVDRTIQNKNKSETTKLVLQKPPSDKVFKQKNEKQISKTDSNRISGNADGVKRLRRHRLVVRLKMSEIIFSIFVLVSASFVLLATAQTVEGNSILCIETAMQRSSKKLIHCLEFDFLLFTAFVYFLLIRQLLSYFWIKEKKENILK